MLPNSIQTHIVFHWIPRHSNIPGNDLADRAEKQATELPPSADFPIAFSSALNVIKNDIRDPAIAHRPSIDNQHITTPGDEVLIARLRSGHHHALPAYLH